MEKKYAEDDEIEIDLRELLFEFKKKIWLIIAALFLGAAAAGAISAFFITPKYKSEAKLYVLSKETTLTSLADLQIGSQLTQDYKVLVSSRPVMEGVISHLNLDLTYKELVKKLSVENPQNTRILTLIVEDTDPYMAKAIVDDIANTASDYIGEIMEMVPPKMIEDGVVASEPFSPNVKKNALIGGILAMLLVCAIITVRVVMNDTVKNEDDVEKYLGLPVLAVIPKKNEKGEKKKSTGHKKSSERKKSSGSHSDKTHPSHESSKKNAMAEESYAHGGDEEMSAQTAKEGNING